MCTVTKWNTLSISKHTFFMEAFFEHLAVEPRERGKQQSLISFTKKETPHINIDKGDAFPGYFFLYTFTEEPEENPLQAFDMLARVAGNLLMDLDPVSAIFFYSPNCSSEPLDDLKLILWIGVAPMICQH